MAESEDAKLVSGKDAFGKTINTVMKVGNARKSLLNSLGKNQNLEVMVERFEKQLVNERAMVNKLRHFAGDPNALLDSGDKPKDYEPDLEDVLEDVDVAAKKANGALDSLRTVAKDRDQQAKDTQAETVRVLEEKEKDEAEIASLKAESIRHQQVQFCSWDLNDAAALVKECAVGTSVRSEDTDDDANTPENWGLLVRDVREFRDLIITDMEAYCKTHERKIPDKNVDLKHICIQSPSTFSHFHIPCEEGTAGQKGQQPLAPDMHLVVERYVKPSCAGKFSWVKVLNKAKKRAPLKATTFVSHSWSEPFTEFVDTLQQALDDMDSIFVSSFSVNHNDAKSQLGEEINSSTSIAALSKSHQLLVAMDARFSLPKRLWCDIEMYTARCMRKPILMWPNAAWNGKLSELQAEIKAIDTSQSSSAVKHDNKKLREFVILNRGGFETLSSTVRDILLDRTRNFARACHSAQQDFSDKHREFFARGLGDDPPVGIFMLAKMRDVQKRLEVECARYVPVVDLLRGDHEFAEVTGQFFPTSDLVEPIYDSTLNCLVSRVRGWKGLNRLKCAATLELGFGTWKVGFIVRRKLPIKGCVLHKEHYFHEKVAFSLNGMVEKCTSLSNELDSQQDGWQIIEIGEVQIPSAGLGLLSRDTFTGIFAHQAFQKGKDIEISATLLWGSGRRILFEGSWVFNGKKYDIRCEEDGVMTSLIDDANKLVFIGRITDEGKDVIFSGDVDRAGEPGGRFKLTMQAETMKSSLEVVMVSNDDAGVMQEVGRPVASPSGKTRSGSRAGLSHSASTPAGFTLPALTVPVPPSYKKQAHCQSKTCPCKTTPHSEFGFFIDRCYASRQSPWLPQT